MKSPGDSAKTRAGFALRYCGCKDAKSVSVVPASLSATASPSAMGTSIITEARSKGRASANPSRKSTTTDTNSASSSFPWEDAMAEFDCDDDGDFKLDSSAAAQSFSGLLRELSELEQSVVSWGWKRHHDKKLLTPPLPQDQERRKVKSSGKGGGDLMTTDKDYPGGDGVEVGLDGSVAVVKQSEDPLGDFRESMLQMIVENGIVAGADLRDMLLRFLTLNAPHHHDVILRAFAEICDTVLEASFNDVPVPVPVPAQCSRLIQPASARTPTPTTTPRHRHQPSAWRM